MLNYPTIAVFVLISQSGLVNSHVYNFRVTQLYANLLINMDHAFEHKVEGLSNIVQQQTQFHRSSLLYDLALKTAEGTTCATPDNMLKLQTFKDSLGNTRKECMTEPACANELHDKAENVISSIQKIDEDAKTEGTACKDEECKLMAYLNRDDKLVQLYQETIPAIRVAADRIVAGAKCSSALLACMDSKNSQSVSQMTTDIANLKECIKSARS